MPRGRTPRQPTRTGRQEGARVARRSRPRKPRSGERLQLTAQAVGHTSRKKNSPEGTEQTDRRFKGRLGSMETYSPSLPIASRKSCAASINSIPMSLAPHPHQRWELLVATILSAQSTDVNVNRVTPELFRKYPTVEAFAAITPEQLEPDVRSTGFFRNKSKSVVGAAKKVVADFGGQVPLNMKDLLTLPGVARKTANVVLGSWSKSPKASLSIPTCTASPAASNSPRT